MISSSMSGCCSSSPCTLAASSVVVLCSMLHKCSHSPAHARTRTPIHLRTRAHTQSAHCACGTRARSESQPRDVLWCMLCVLHIISFAWKAAHAVVCKVVVPRVQSRLVSVARYWTCRCLRQERGSAQARSAAWRLNCTGRAAEVRWATQDAPNRWKDESRAAGNGWQLGAECRLKVCAVVPAVAREAMKQHNRLPVRGARRHDVGRHLSLWTHAAQPCAWPAPLPRAPSLSGGVIHVQYQLLDPPTELTSLISVSAV